MRSMNTDPDGYSPSDTIARLHRTIDSGKYGIDFTIDPRPKNEKLLQQFILSNDDRIKILRSLSVANYDGWEMSTNTSYPNDIIHFFHCDANLMRKFVEDAPTETIKLYIKLTWAKPDCLLFVISLHEADLFD